MKFSKDLRRNQIPDWSASYIDYKGLKKLVRLAVGNGGDGKRVDSAEFLTALHKSLEIVDSFYNKEIACIRHQLKFLDDYHGQISRGVVNLGDDEIKNRVDKLLHFKSRLCHLQEFGDLNRKGFAKITKKLDKKLPHPITQHWSVSKKVDSKPFAQAGGIASQLSRINRWVRLLSEILTFDNALVGPWTHTLHQASMTQISNLSQLELELFDQAVRNDNISFFQERSKTTKGAFGEDSQLFTRGLLQRAISARAKQCIAFFLANLDHGLEDSDDFSKRNCIHRLVIQIGRVDSTRRDRDTKPGNLDAGAQQTGRYLSSNPSREYLELLQLLVYLLDNLHPEQRIALKGQDAFGRMPLHYAAELGLAAVIQNIKNRLQEWHIFDIENDLDDLEWQDHDGWVPLHLSVAGRHPMTTETLVQGGSKAQIRKRVFKFGALLCFATESNDIATTQVLVDAGVDLNWSNQTGETALHIAARLGYVECAQVILAGNEVQKPNLQSLETLYAWTPLHISAVNGKLGMAKLLVDAGADIAYPDACGWMAQEHASWRGHMEVARLLAAHTGDEKTSLRIIDTLESTSLEVPSVNRCSSNKETRAPSRQRAKVLSSQYLVEESLFLLNLGSVDMSNDIEPVNLCDFTVSKLHRAQPHSSISIVIAASEALGEQVAIDLAHHDKFAAEPIVFRAKDVSKTRILFDVVSEHSGNARMILGRGVALMPPNLDSKKTKLRKDIRVPIISSDLNMIGTVNFSVSIITPFHHPNMGPISRQTDWKMKLPPSTLIGHRGLGKNQNSTNSLQLGENTLPSFNAAADLGAHYVEFDVQLTKDLVPIIYHDFLVSETGADIPVHSITLQQFLHLKPDFCHSHGNTAKAQGEFSSLRRRRNSLPAKPCKSKVVNSMASKDQKNRMKFTKDFIAKGFKGNTRGSSIEAPFATLEDLFRHLPDTIGFNIEVKYPMLQESQQHGMDDYNVELNVVCDTILSKVFDLVRKRRVIFSSFNPDICIYLCLKQSAIPVLFLTDAGCDDVFDMRCSSLQKAVDFASYWNLFGIVSTAEPLVNSPRLVDIIKQKGLVCATYGTLNNDPTMVEIQARRGVDAFIVDRVLCIRKMLELGHD